MAPTATLPRRFDKLAGFVAFTRLARVVEVQDDLVGEFRSLAQAAGLRGADIVIDERAKSGDKPILVIDVKSEPLLFNVTSENVLFRVSEGHEPDVLPPYLRCLLQAVVSTVKPGAPIGFEVQGRRILAIDGAKNYQVMQSLLPGLAMGEHLFASLPSSHYQVQRTDVTVAITVGSYDYIYVIEAPANDNWSTLWFTFVVRSSDSDHLGRLVPEHIAELANQVFTGDPLMQALCRNVTVRLRG